MTTGEAGLPELALGQALCLNLTMDWNPRSQIKTIAH